MILTSCTSRHGMTTGLAAPSMWRRMPSGERTSSGSCGWATRDSSRPPLTMPATIQAPANDGGQGLVALDVVQGEDAQADQEHGDEIVPLRQLLAVVAQNLADVGGRRGVIGRHGVPCPAWRVLRMKPQPCHDAAGWREWRRSQRRAGGKRRDAEAAFPGRAATQSGATQRTGIHDAPVGPCVLLMCQDGRCGREIVRSLVLKTVTRLLIPARP